MRYRQLHEAAGQRTLVVVLAAGDEVVDCLQALARKESLSAAQVSAIGAVESAMLAYFDWEQKRYCEIPVPQQAEVLTLAGDIALDQDGGPKIHVHAVLGRRDGSTVGGHLMSARVRPTLEVVITESPVHLRRRHDPQSGLTLIDPDLKA